MSMVSELFSAANKMTPFRAHGGPDQRELLFLFSFDDLVASMAASYHCHLPNLNGFNFQLLYFLANIANTNWILGILDLLSLVTAQVFVETSR
ncbi:hypothetical protein Lal_00047278 [Lupinus albus]|nr:hypothetical protein Lal_00047278 [Lupinus albus]